MALDRLPLSIAAGLLPAWSITMKLIAVGAGWVRDAGQNDLKMACRRGFLADALDPRLALSKPPSP
jgi:hypothetical protein